LTTGKIGAILKVVMARCYKGKVTISFWSGTLRVNGLSELYNHFVAVFKSCWLIQNNSL